MDRYQTAPGKAFCTVLGSTQRGWVELGSDHGGQVLEDPSEGVFVVQPFSLDSHGL